MTGAWDSHYAALERPFPYGGDASYRIAADFVRGHGTIEDWGCGGGWLRRFLEGEPYVGIDGSCTPFADYVYDLTDYTSEVDSIVLRHVLEHSYRWRDILDNAVASFRHRLCVILFTPLAPRTRVLHTEPDYANVPVISFAPNDILSRLPNLGTVPNPATIAMKQVVGGFYGTETIIMVTR